MAKNRGKFTKAFLERQPIPAKGVNYVYDTEVPWLRCGIHPTGRRSFGFLKKTGNQVITIPLGPFPAVSIEQARQQANEKIAALARGEDPRQKPEADDGMPTLGDFFERYVRQHFDGKPRSQKNARAGFDRYLDKWRDWPLDKILRADVEQLHADITKAHGPVAANRVLTFLSSVYNKARHWGIFNGDNPVRGVRRHREFPRRRVLDRSGEFQKFREALDKEQDADLRLYLKIRLFNGIRERNIFEMKWDDLDLDRRVWHIAETKTGAPLLVPLAAPIVDELRSRPRKSQWVFPGHKKGTHLTTVARDWRRFRKSLKLTENLELRDLRRTFASYALWAGMPISLIGNLMGHENGSRITALVYAQPDEQLRREAIATVEQKMLCG